MALLFGSKKPLLEIELVPKTAWGKNLRAACLQYSSMYPTTNWDRLRKLTYERAGYRCEVCSGRGPKWPVEAHEVWDYREDLSVVQSDPSRYVQRLDRLIALCPACHEVKHFGLAEKRGRRNEAKEHLCLINNWSHAQAEDHFGKVGEIWALRSLHKWKLDLGGLLDYGVTESDAMRLAASIDRLKADAFSDFEDNVVDAEDFDGRRRTW